MTILKPVNVIAVKDINEGLGFTKKLLYDTIDKNTALFLSGGKTPKPLYQDLAKEKKLNVGSVAMVDERLGPQFHKNSNERMIRETRLLEHLSLINVPFYGILQELHRHSGKSVSRLTHPESLARGDSEQARMTAIENVAEEYDKTVSNLFAKLKKRVAIMGIGEDSHTAGLPAGTKNLKFRTKNYVVGINDFPGEFKDRITLTFKALEKMDLLIVLVFGSSKKNVLKLMFTKGSIEEIPARFYNLPDISKKTIVITDQKM